MGPVHVSLKRMEKMREERTSARTESEREMK